MKALITTVSLLISSQLGQAATTVLLTAGSISDPVNWSLGLPTGANDGLIDIDGATANNLNLIGWGGATVNHTSGTIAGQFNPANNSSLTWNINDAAVYDIGSKAFFANDITVNIKGGTINGGTNQGLYAANGGNMTMSGGTVSTSTSHGVRVTSTSTLTLSGGVFNGSNVVNLFTDSGNVSVGGLFIGNMANATSFGTANLEFSSSWTGSLSLDSSTDWSAELISSGATIDGIDIDGLNINNFDLSTAGLITVVPEPTSTLLVSVCALGLIVLRRRQR